MNDQSIEIERMNIIAVNLSDDPRSKLSAGHHDAEEAILNLKKVASLKKPIGFYNPNNPKSKGIKNPDFLYLLIWDYLDCRIQ